MTTRRTVTLAPFATLAALALPRAARAQESRLLFNSFIQPQHPANTRVLKPWVEDIAKATGGRVKIEIPPSSLAAPQQQIDGVTKGVFDMAYQFHGFMAPRVRLAQLAHLPGVNTTARGSSVALWRTREKFFRAADEYKDVHLLALWVGAGGLIFGTKGPVESVAQIRGTRMFGLPGPAAKVLEDAGAGVVAAPAVRSHEIVSGGTVDAFAGYALMDAHAFKTLQYAKHVTALPGHLTAPSFALFVNRRKWESIAATDRDAITRLSGEAFAQRLAAYDEVEAKIAAEAQAAGVRFHQASPAFAAEIAKLAEPQLQAWLGDAKAAGVDGAAALEFYRQQAAANARAAG